MQVVSRFLNSVLCDLQQSIWSISYAPYGILNGKNGVFLQPRIFTPGIYTPHQHSSFNLRHFCMGCLHIFFQLVIPIFLFQTFPLPLIIVLLNLCVASSPVCPAVSLNQRKLSGCGFCILILLNTLLKIQNCFISVFLFLLLKL